jgi:antitoxin component of MazEF toxin-antitoxin module
MKKKFGENIETVQVDAITGEYYITIPEWMMNELSWYEDTEINISLDGKDIILTEYEHE